MLVNTWNSCHGAGYHNRRFYFNPTTNLLEPIAFDNGPKPLEREEHTENCDVFVSRHLMGNEEFQQHVLDFSEALLATSRSPEWQSWFLEYQAQQMSILSLEKMDTKPLLARNIVRNIAYFLQALEFKGSGGRLTAEGTRDEMESYPDAPLYTHLRAFLFPSDTTMRLELKNVSYESISDIRLIVSDSKADSLIIDGPELLPAYDKNAAAGSRAHIVSLDIERQHGWTPCVRHFFFQDEWPVHRPIGAAVFFRPCRCQPPFC